MDRQRIYMATKVQAPVLAMEHFLERRVTKKNYGPPQHGWHHVVRVQTAGGWVVVQDELAAVAGCHRDTFVEAMDEAATRWKALCREYGFGEEREDG